jgi:hypothetical protein
MVHVITGQADMRRIGCLCQNDEKTQIIQIMVQSGILKKMPAVACLTLKLTIAY